MQGLLQNRLMEKAKQLTPEVGMGATIILYSDRSACTIIEVAPRRIVLQRDKTEEVGEQYSNIWKTTPDPKGAKDVFTLRKNGRWVKEKQSMHGTSALIGHRDHHFDYEF